MDLVTILPSMVIGPVYSTRGGFSIDSAAVRPAPPQKTSLSEDYITLACMILLGLTAC